MLQYGTPINPMIDSNTLIQDVSRLSLANGTVFQLSLRSFLDVYRVKKDRLSLRQLASTVDAEAILITRRQRSAWISTSSFDEPFSAPCMSLKQQLMLSNNTTPKNLLIDLDLIYDKSLSIIKRWLATQNIRYIVFLSLDAGSSSSVCLFFNALLKTKQPQLNDYWITGHIADRFFGHMGDQLSELTPRQLECLYWAALGKSETDTAEILGVANTTIKYHLRDAGLRLGAPNKTAAVAMAIAQGLIEL